MAQFAADQFAGDQFHAGQFGLQAAPTFPDAGADGPGWYATDQGIVGKLGQVHRKNAGDFRRYFVDWSALQNVRGGDVFDTEVAATAGGSPAGLTAANVEYDTALNRVWFTLDGGSPSTIYSLAVTAAFVSEIGRASCRERV